jgi:hypothetical protein
VIGRRVEFDWLIKGKGSVRGVFMGCKFKRYKGVVYWHFWQKKTILKGLSDLSSQAPIFVVKMNLKNIM